MFNNRFEKLYRPIIRFYCKTKQIAKLKLSIRLAINVRVTKAKAYNTMYTMKGCHKNGRVYQN